MVGELVGREDGPVKRRYRPMTIMIDVDVAM